MTLKTHLAHARIPEALWLQLHAIADREEMPFSQVVRKALRVFAEQDQKQQKGDVQ